MKTRFEVREIDGWFDGDGWYWNTSFSMGNFETSAKNEKRAFMDYLKKRGISFKLNRTLIEFDGDIYSVIDRKTKEPLFAAIPIYA